jgi:hypothetical protein
MPRHTRRRSTGSGRRTRRHNSLAGSGKTIDKGEARKRAGCNQGNSIISLAKLNNTAVSGRSVVACFFRATDSPRLINQMSAGHGHAGNTAKQICNRQST